LSDRTGTVDEKNCRLILKDFNMEIEFARRLKWYGKQDRLEIYYDESRKAWYASIPVEVGIEETRTGKKSRHIIHGERKSVQIESPKGDKIASIDPGINVIAIVLKAQEYGIRIFEFVEYSTSKYCAYHGVEVERRMRGVVSCPGGHRLHSDLNGALNIIRKAAGTVPAIKKPPSFIVDHNRVAVKGV